jgi:hypothetical protein
MKVLSHTSLLVVAIGGLFSATNASAADVTYYQSSTMSGNCQSFEPGVTNTLRNRALGVENVGSSTLGMACSFEPQTTGGTPGVPTSYNSLTLWFHGTAGQVITCTVLAGHYWSSSSFMSQSVTLGASGDGSLTWNSSTTNWATTTGKYGLSATCMLPPGAWATNSHFAYVASNGA